MKNVDMNKPKVFIGSSKEDMPLATAMLDELQRVCLTQCWWNHFGNISGRTNLDEILEFKDVDFAVIILGAHDQLVIRDQKMSAPRDNLVFELGFFIGLLGVERALFVAPSENESYHLPSDLRGINPITYRPIGGDLNNIPLGELRNAMVLPAKKIAQQIESLGFRGTLSDILFHPVVKFEDHHLWFRIGYKGEDTLNDVSFRLYYVERFSYDDGGPARKWTELTLGKSFIPEVSLTFHVSHDLNLCQLRLHLQKEQPTHPLNLDQLRQLPEDESVFHLTISGKDSRGRCLRSRKIYHASHIKAGRFFSVNATDGRWTNWDTKPHVDWGKFEMFEETSDAATGRVSACSGT